MKSLEQGINAGVQESQASKPSNKGHLPKAFRSPALAGRLFLASLGLGGGVGIISPALATGLEKPGDPCTVQTTILTTDKVTNKPVEDVYYTLSTGYGQTILRTNKDGIGENIQDPKHPAYAQFNGKAERVKDGKDIMVVTVKPSAQQGREYELDCNRNTTIPDKGTLPSAVAALSARATEGARTPVSTPDNRTATAAATRTVEPSATATQRPTEASTPVPAKPAETAIPTAIPENPIEPPVESGNPDRGFGAFFHDFWFPGVAWAGDRFDNLGSGIDTVATALHDHETPDGNREGNLVLGFVGDRFSDIGSAVHGVPPLGFIGDHLNTLILPTALVGVMRRFAVGRELIGFGVAILMVPVRLLARGGRWLWDHRPWH